MRRRRLSYFHRHSPSIVGLLARRILPLRTSVTIHGPDEFKDPEGFYLRDKIRQFDLLVTISEYGRSQLMRHSDQDQWSKFRASRLGVDPALYVPRPFPENPSPFHILCDGRLPPVNGHHIPIAALDRLVRQG